MKRIIAFGCSNTYGQGLEDCIDEQKIHAGPSPSEFAWPAIIGKELDIPVVNTSRPGNSNYHLLHNIINFDWQEGDVAVILFTYFGRYTIFYDHRKPINITPGMLVTGEHIMANEFYNVFNNHHLYKMDAEYLDHIFYFLNYNKIDYQTRFPNLGAHSYYRNTSKIVDAKWHQPIFKDYWDTAGVDYALDVGQHAGPKSHENFANNIIDSIRR